jgi:hypothetical protein
MYYIVYIYIHIYTYIDTDMYLDIYIHTYIHINRHTPSPNSAAVIDMAAIVPMQYDNKNEKADFHVVIAKAGAIL